MEKKRDGSKCFSIVDDLISLDLKKNPPLLFQSSDILIHKFSIFLAFHLPHTDIKVTLLQHMGHRKLVLHQMLTGQE